MDAYQFTDLQAFLFYLFSPILPWAGVITLAAAMVSSFFVAMFGFARWLIYRSDAKED